MCWTNRKLDHGYCKEFKEFGELIEGQDVIIGYGTQLYLGDALTYSRLNTFLADMHGGK